MSHCDRYYIEGSNSNWDGRYEKINTKIKKKVKKERKEKWEKGRDGGSKKRKMTSKL